MKIWREVVLAVITAGVAHAQDSVIVPARDSAARAATTLSAVTIREHAHYNAVKSELDQRRRAGFGYRADSLDLARLPGLAEAFNFPGVRFSRIGARWSIWMTGVYSITARGAAGASLGCTPTIWLDGTISNIEMLNALTKEEVGLVEVFNSAARAPLQYGGTRTNCGVVLVWRKRYIEP